MRGVSTCIAVSKDTTFLLHMYPPSCTDVLLTIAGVDGGFALQRQRIVRGYPAVVAAACFEQRQPLSAVFFATAAAQRATQRPFGTCNKHEGLSCVDKYNLSRRQLLGSANELHQKIAQNEVFKLTIRIPSNSSLTVYGAYVKSKRRVATEPKVMMGMAAMVSTATAARCCTATTTSTASSPCHIAHRLMPQASDFAQVQPLHRAPPPRLQGAVRSARIERQEVPRL